jgi:hypothetical protein
MRSDVGMAIDGPGKSAGAGVLAVIAAALALAGCAGTPTGSYGPGDLQPGQTEADAVKTMGPPTGRYDLGQGAVRLEYARGPSGYHTYMIDLDAQGRITGIEQVLSPQNFARQLKLGMDGDAVLRAIGRPAQERPVGFVGRSVWSWRYFTTDCLWFQVTYGPDGKLLDTGGYLPDPACDPGTFRQ